MSFWPVCELSDNAELRSEKRGRFLGLFQEIAHGRSIVLGYKNSSIPLDRVLKFNAVLQRGIFVVTKAVRLEHPQAGCDSRANAGRGKKNRI